MKELFVAAKTEIFSKFEAEYLVDFNLVVAGESKHGLTLNAIENQ